MENGEPSINECKRQLNFILSDLEKRSDNLYVQEEMYSNMKLRQSRLEEDLVIAKYEFQSTKNQLKLHTSEMKYLEEYIKEEERNIHRLTLYTKKQASFLRTQEELDETSEILQLLQSKMNRIDKEKNISSLFKNEYLDWSYFENVLPLQFKKNNNNNIRDCEIKNGEFNIISNWETLRANNEGKKSSVLLSFGDDEDLSNPTHHELYLFIKRLLMDAIKLCNLQNELKVTIKNREGQTPDFFEIINGSNIIIGKVEINIDENTSYKKVVGQCFDNIFENQNSKNEAFSILISNKDARVFFTENSKQLAAAKTIDCQYPLTSEPINGITHPSNIQRILFSSNVVNFNNPNDLFALLCTAIIKMNSCKQALASITTNSPSIPNEILKATTSTAINTTNTTLQDEPIIVNENNKRKSNSISTLNTPKQRRRVSALYQPTKN
ncbi:hypothetical protein ACTA71_008066 [Dictyostelium dimigraforme]